MKHLSEMMRRTLTRTRNLKVALRILSIKIDMSRTEHEMMREKKRRAI